MRRREARARATIEPDELLEHLDAAGLSRCDMPEYFLRLDELPLMRSGKSSSDVSWSGSTVFR